MTFSRVVPVFMLRLPIFSGASIVGYEYDPKSVLKIEIFKFLCLFYADGPLNVHLNEVQEWFHNL